MDGAGTVLRTYIWLEGRLVAMVAGTTLYHVHTGHLGQPLKMTNASKAVVWDADMEPFGQVALATNTVSQDIRLPGQWEQAEAGLFQNWYRDYDPVLGRYLQADPIGLAGGANVYGYVGGEPLRRMDPRGLDAIVVTKRFGPAGYMNHQGMFIGNDRNGWKYYEDSGAGGPTGKARVENFFERSKPTMSTADMEKMVAEEFDKAMRHGATPEQDELMRDAAREHMRKAYLFIGNNCGDLAKSALDAADIPFPDTTNPRATMFGAPLGWSDKKLSENGWRNDAR